MATTDLTGSPAECLSAPAHGMAGDARGDGVVGAAAGVMDEDGVTGEASSVDVGLSVAEASSADAALLTVLWVASMAALAVDFTAAQREAFTVEAVSTAEAVDSTAVQATAGDTGNRRLIRRSPVR